jgi:hypothetical protein
MVSLPAPPARKRALAMHRVASASTLLSLAAFVIAAATAAVVVSDRLGGGDGDVVRGSGIATASPATMDLGVDRRARVMFPVQEPPGAPHVNTMISLAHNWDWAAASGWMRDDPAQPSVALTVESWFRGLAELNFDMEPPQGDTAQGGWPGGRAMGLAARYDGSFAILQVGGPPYRPGAAGVAFTGGMTADPIVTIIEADGGHREALRVQRPNGQPSVSLSGGASPALAFGLAGRPADALDVGVLRIAGAPAQGPIINLAGTGYSPILTARLTERDPVPSFRIGADGRLEWGNGLGPADTALGRTGPGRFEARGELAVSGLRIGRGSALQNISVFSLELTPDLVAAGSTADQLVRVVGLPEGGVVLVNGPEQPAGMGLAGARMQGRERLAIRFFNVGAEAGRPTAGRYLVLLVDSGED